MLNRLTVTGFCGHCGIIPIHPVSADDTLLVLLVVIFFRLLRLLEVEDDAVDAKAEVRGGRAVVENMTSTGDMGYLDKPLIGIVAAHSWRIIANYKQGYLGQLHPNGTAWVWLDTHPWRFYRARIRGIARGISRQPEDTGLLPYVTPTTDWIRLQHRFPVTLILVNPPPDLTYYMGADATCVVLP